MIRKLAIVLFSVFYCQMHAQKMVPLKVECEWDESLVTNGSCQMDPIPTGGALMNIQATFQKETTEFWIYHANYEKKGRNFHRGIFKANIDICDFNNAFKGTLFNKFADNMMEYTKHLIHPCPYSGTLLIKDYQFDGSSFHTKFLRPATYRFDYRVYNEHNLTYFYLKYYAVVKK